MQWDPNAIVIWYSTSPIWKKMKILRLWYLEKFTFWGNSCFHSTVSKELYSNAIYIYVKKLTDHFFHDKNIKLKFSCLKMLKILLYWVTIYNCYKNKIKIVISIKLIDASDKSIKTDYFRNAFLSEMNGTSSPCIHLCVYCSSIFFTTRKLDFGVNYTAFSGCKYWETLLE